MNDNPSPYAVHEAVLDLLFGSKVWWKMHIVSATIMLGPGTTLTVDMRCEVWNDDQPVIENDRIVEVQKKFKLVEV